MKKTLLLVTLSSIIFFARGLVAIDTSHIGSIGELRATIAQLRQAATYSGAGCAGAITENASGEYFITLSRMETADAVAQLRALAGRLSTGAELGALQSELVQFEIYLLTKEVSELQTKLSAMPSVPAAPSLLSTPLANPDLIPLAATPTGIAAVEKKIGSPIEPSATLTEEQKIKELRRVISAIHYEANVGTYVMTSKVTSQTLYPSKPAPYIYSEPYWNQSPSYVSNRGSLFHLTDRSKIVVRVAAAVLVLAVCGTGVVCHTYSDSSYIASADSTSRDDHDRHIENLVQIIEGHGSFGTPAPKDQTEALRVLTKHFLGVGRNSTYVAPEQIERIVTAVYLGKMDAYHAAPFMRRLLKEPAIWDTVTTTQPNRQKLETLCKVVLAKTDLDSRFRVELATFVFQFEKKQFSDLPFSLRWNIETALKEEILKTEDQVQPNRFYVPMKPNFVHDDTELSAAARVAQFGFKDSSAVVEKWMTTDPEFRRAIFKSEQKTFFMLVLSLKVGEVIRTYGQPEPRAPWGWFDAERRIR